MRFYNHIIPIFSDIFSFLLLCESLTETTGETDYNQRDCAESTIKSSRQREKISLFSFISFSYTELGRNTDGSDSHELIFFKLTLSIFKHLKKNNRGKEDKWLDQSQKGSVCNTSDSEPKSVFFK